eukprot:s15_g52.t1
MDYGCITWIIVQTPRWMKPRALSPGLRLQHCVLQPTCSKRLRSERSADAEMLHRNANGKMPAANSIPAGPAFHTKAAHNCGCQGWDACKALQSHSDSRRFSI